MGGCQEGQGHWAERQGDRAQVRAARWRAGPWVSHWVRPPLAGKAVATTQRRASRSEFHFISGVLTK